MDVLVDTICWGTCVCEVAKEGIKGGMEGRRDRITSCSRHCSMTNTMDRSSFHAIRVLREATRALRGATRQDPPITPLMSHSRSRRSV